MELRIGAPVDCADQACGTLTRVVVEPRSWTVTHIVVEPPAGHVSARLVPLEMVTSAGARVTLTCRHFQWQSLQYVEEIRFVDDRTVGSWGALLLWPLSGFGGAELPQVVEHLPLGEVELSAEAVHAATRQIGRLDGVVTDRNGQLTHVLVREGHFWRKREVSIPASSLEAVKTDGLHVVLSPTPPGTAA